MQPRVSIARTPGDLEPGKGHRALLFDWDGTLADSHELNFAVLDQALRLQGARLDPDGFALRTGVSTREMVAQVASELGITVDTDRAAQTRDRLYLEQLGGVREISPVADLLRRESPRRKTALATGGARRTVTATAEALGLLDLFDTVVSREDVTAGKPAPDVFLLAARRLGVAAESCLVFEDSDEGLEAAHLAGMDAIDVRPLRSSIVNPAARKR